MDDTIDDFGTGYSSLIQLLRLSFSEIKVDKSFVLSMLKPRESALIVKTVIDLAHNLSLTATAEGVEDDATLQQLSLLGCDFAQGFGLCQPQPREQKIESVTAWNSAQVARQRLTS